MKEGLIVILLQFPVALVVIVLGIYREMNLGSIPETVAKRCPRTVFVVKWHPPVKALMGRVASE